MNDWVDDIKERNQAWLDHDIEDTWSYIDRNELLKLIAEQRARLTAETARAEAKCLWAQDIDGYAGFG